MNKIKYLTGCVFSVVSVVLVGCDDDIEFEIPEAEKHIRVYQDDQMLACDPASAIALSTSAQLLAENSIEIHCSQKGYDGFSYPESCGSDTGSINVFTIHKGDLNEAETLGFAPLSDLPEAVVDRHCEYKVISDHKKFHLLADVKAAIEDWQDTDTQDYEFEFQQSFVDCPNVAAPPKVRVTVENEVITQVYDLDNQQFLNNLDDYQTISALLEAFKLQIWMTPRKAALSASELDKLPEYSEQGVPLSYYYDQGSAACDAPNTQLSNFVDLSSN
ncbi:DUF6174 domain-containing protein [Catenovulum sediminis]|uniref:DUF6174 domain-containing protein n=1 Tax=Catenovulum sediminis TaxID=1740262 RepID=UPI00117D27DF|nr:DUF6174 domain-containing protein [Catenovulum sediminis]